MNESSSKGTGAILIAAVIGLIALLLFYGLFSFGFFGSFVIGVLVAIIVWIVLWLGWGDTGPEGTTAKPVEPSADPIDEMNTGTTTGAEFIKEPPATAGARTKKAAAASPVGAETGTTASAPTARAPAERAPKKAEVNRRANTVEKTQDAPAKASASAPMPPEAPTKEAKPATLDSPRPEGADDLKRIKGVGPGIEKTLNELGIYHFDQIADWGPEEVQWVDSRIRFKGRIQRDDWMGQAKALLASREN